MKPIHLFIVFFLLTFTSEVAAQNNFVSSQIGKQLAEYELNQTLLKERVGNVVNTKFNLLKNSKTAIAVAEPLLFATYGEKTIVDQRPYEVHQVEDYWVILGKSAREAAGSEKGYFLIILNKFDSRVFRMDYLRR
ncbi:MAG: YbbC/YhhH family protein [Flavobacteriaceae bacterium]|nr:YbbC/YhhH family protein [Flavobacteriaceae bacterium]